MIASFKTFSLFCDSENSIIIIISIESPNEDRSMPSPEPTRLGNDIELFVSK